TAPTSRSWSGGWSAAAWAVSSTTRRAGMPTPASPEQPERPPRRRFKATCQGCQRQVTRNSTRARTWTCPHCDRVNPGPGLTEEMAKPPEAGARRRLQRRQAAAAAASTPAPVRRRRTSQAGAPAQGAADGEPARKGGASAVDAPVQARSAPPHRASWFDRLLYGEDE